jgi:hypothetical protein
MRTARFQIVNTDTSSLYSRPTRASTREANGRDRRFPPGWWMIPSILPGLVLVIWAITKLI